MQLHPSRLQQPSENTSNYQSRKAKKVTGEDKAVAAEGRRGADLAFWKNAGDAGGHLEEKPGQ